MIPAALRPLQDRGRLPQIFSLLFALAQQRPASHETRRDGRVDTGGSPRAIGAWPVNGADGVEGPPGSPSPNSVEAVRIHSLAGLEGTDDGNATRMSWACELSLSGAASSRTPARLRAAPRLGLTGQYTIAPWRGASDEPTGIAIAKAVLCRRSFAAP